MEDKMKNIKITYCTSWGYQGRASRLEAIIKEEMDDVTVELVQGSGGIFIVESDGTVVFNNKEEGVKFPDEHEVVQRLYAL